MAATKSRKKREVKSFLVEVEGLNCNVVNDAFNDYEMIGLLKVLLNAYELRFKQGGGENGKESNPGE